MKNILLFSSILVGTSLLSGTPRVGSSPVKYLPLGTTKRVNASSGPIGTISIIIDKSDYELSIYDSKGWYATYPVVFGNNSLSDKKMEGDKNTPEGDFHILTKRIHEKWDRYMALDYPTKESWDKFHERKQRGEIPASAAIGGSIGIHGTWPHEDFVVDRYKNWTDGCISMKNADVEEIYGFTQAGTKVTIRK